ncbi:sensor histidine kinase efflux regulator BaeS [Stenotrophomonas sp. 24(2023)]|uniref:sensor histidine kinase efflux regulator BaeS n=1 Tax=Stenotrophomonas sp. 24(2023) TaxID=3068324 RepID=UPI0027E1C8C1|nr:sensor histidine kinase efflux regulator BaeS [Stenotrophomonas sp. 24(2023)]WMJ70905.1 sensor histidine kinase efflux regulator BaeS [Stenotrophomonas sp. 24(2023)]
MATIRLKFGLTAKSFLAIFTACLLVLAVNGVATRVSFQLGFLDYLNEQGDVRMQHLLPHLAHEYEQHQGWDHLRSSREGWDRLLRPDLGHSHGLGPVSPPLSDQTGVPSRLGLFDAQLRRVAGNADARNDDDPHPVVVNGQTVGWLGMVPFQRVIAANDLNFYNTQLRAWWVIGIALLLVTAVLAWIVSRALQRRLATLAAATHQLAAGEYGIRIARTSDDELDALAADFNQMAQALDDTERNRRAFIADISHELRTPLAVVRAELEAIEDGIRPLDRANLGALQGEIRQLGKLIDDLHDLSMTQSGGMAYRFAPLDLVALLHSELNSMRGRFQAAGLALEVEVPAPPLTVSGDERRLQQLLANLLENALRYTQAGGTVCIHAEHPPGLVRLVVEDSAPGVPADKCALLFERFYRVESSRNRASGGSGLGLAISRNIVHAHQGHIHAEPSPLGGLRVVIELPETT